MKIYVRDRRLGEAPLGAILMLPLFVLPFGAWLIEHGHYTFDACLAKVALDLPCLSCGATRGTLRLFHGDLIGAIALQPMMIAIYAALLLWGLISFVSFVRCRRVVLHLSDREDLALKIAVVAVPLVNWVYLWRAGI